MFNHFRYIIIIMICITVTYFQRPSLTTYLSHTINCFFFSSESNHDYKKLSYHVQALENNITSLKEAMTVSAKDIMTRLNFYASSTKEKDMVYATLFTFWKEWSLSLGTIVLGFLLLLLLLFSLQRFKKIRALHRG